MTPTLLRPLAATLLGAVLLSACGYDDSEYIEAGDATPAPGDAQPAPDPEPEQPTPAPEPPTGDAAPLEIATDILPSGSVEQPYAHALAATGGVAPYAWSVMSGSLPPGLALGTDGQLTGTPSAGGVHHVTVQVEDSGAPAATASRAYTLTISGAAPPVNVP